MIGRRRAKRIRDIVSETEEDEQTSERGAAATSKGIDVPKAVGEKRTIRKVRDQ